MSKLKKRRRHTGSPTQSSLSAPATSQNQVPEGGCADNLSPVPRDSTVTDLTATAVAGEVTSCPPPVPFGPRAPKVPSVKFDASDGKTPKRRESSATTGSGAAAASSGRKYAATPSRTRSIGAQIRSIFGLDDQEANQQKQESSKMGTDDASKWGPYAVKNHTVRHPILGNMTIPAITSDPETSSNKSNDGDGCTTGIEFRKSLGINEAEVSFPSSDDAARSKRRSSRRSSNSKYRLGDGLRVPLIALAFPTLDPVETAAEALTEQDRVITKQSTDNQAPCDGFSGIGSIQIISERGATIRELYDLDLAEVSLGRLGQHERRSYVEKKWLTEPPPEGDEEEDEECVGVMRYKVILSAEDRQKLASKGLAHYEFGWISDRGRLVSDPYVICKEV